jgi:hypothetical protein
LCCLLQELLVQVLALEPVLLALGPELEQELLPVPGLLALPRRNAESGCNHLLFQALLHTVFR